MEMKTFESSEGNVWKYVLEFPNAIAESVLYKYKDFKERTVICSSVQSGCPVGCSFCGTGKNFARDLTVEEIVQQSHNILEDKNINPKKVKKLQLMFMSMGEPFLNYNNVEGAIKELNQNYKNAQLLVSTIAPKKQIAFRKFVDLSEKIDQIGLQFSIHRSTNKERNTLIPYKNKLTLEELRDYGIHWWKATDRNPYCNYCIGKDNHKDQDFENLRQLFPPNVFYFTFSVICSKDQTMKETAFRNLDTIEEFRKKFEQEGYNTRVFDPAGQDDIGGGCGQLWYVQEYFRRLK